MVHSEHDAKFWILFSQLKKEYESLDWTKSTYVEKILSLFFNYIKLTFYFRAHTLRGGTIVPNINKNMENNWQEDSSDEENDDSPDATAHTLNPNADIDVIHQLNPKELAAEAATLRWMSRQNKDVTDQDPKTTDPHHHHDPMEIEHNHNHDHSPIHNHSNGKVDKEAKQKEESKQIQRDNEQPKKEPWECPSCTFINEVTEQYANSVIIIDQSCQFKRHKI
jgi:hypothetical protein